MLSSEEKKANILKTYMLLGSMSDIEILDFSEPYVPIITGNLKGENVDFTLAWKKSEPNLILCFNVEFCKVNRVIYYDKENKAMHFFSHVSDITDLNVDDYTEETLWKFAVDKKGMCIGHPHIICKEHPQIIYYDDCNAYNFSVYNALNVYNKSRRFNGDLLILPINKFVIDKFWEG
ncbi:MAG TPA: hypothetical protein VK190_03635 [Pseudoneobacillus sp.]|nr:hypothetical protein [Pseudoneobacillus sp.]